MKQRSTLTDAHFYKYHELSKHTFDKLMASNYQLDWQNQPNPFRSFAGSKLILLPAPEDCFNLGYFEALEAMLEGQGVSRSNQEINLPKAQANDLNFLSHLLFYSMAISAWKQLGNTAHRWSLRVNPSSGDLHPTETHLLINSVTGMEPGAYHYDVLNHRLEQRCSSQIAHSVWQQLAGSEKSPCVIVCFTSIFWRESWKYRDRAFRYCHHDLGHAMAALMLSSAALGWRAEVVGEFPDSQLAESLGLASTDEHPALLIGLRPGLAVPAHAADGLLDLPESWQQPCNSFLGVPNQLSSKSLKYDSIDKVYASTCLSIEQWQSRLRGAYPSGCQRISTVSARGAEQELTYSSKLSGAGGVHRLVRKRRSAVDLDGKQEMRFDQLGNILISSTRGFRADFQGTTGWRPSTAYLDSGHHLIHLYLYVHRVVGLKPGIYYLDRVGQVLVPLLLADQRDAAKFYSCFQDIAADGCFAISMIADFNLAYELYGDRCYRYVHYEAGWIGQLLYLSALDLGYEATGIGCFIDDLINQHLDLPNGYEVIYNFTVGRAVIDPRLTTLPSYEFSDPALDSKGD